MKIHLHTTRDRFSDCGYQYFKNTYGFDPESSDVIAFTLDDVHLTKNNAEKIQGWIQIDNKKIPVFKVPADLSDRGKPLVFFYTTRGNYPCAVETGDSVIVSIDIFYHLGFCLSGNLEEIWKSHPDQRCDLIRIPFMDYYAGFLFDLIRQMYVRLQLPFVHTSFWPEGKTCAVCLTHDVDEVKKTYQWITYPIKMIMRGKRGILLPQCRSLIQKIRGNEPYWTFDEILRVEGARGVKSSFYFLQETGKVHLSDKKTWRHLGRRYDVTAPHVRELLHNLNSSGWEVGLHGSFYSYLDPEKLRHEKEALERSLGTAVWGGRQHNLNLKIPETWLNQEKAGLSYDTTLGYNDCPGFRWGTSFPFLPFFLEENRNLDVLQIPLAIEDLPYFRSQEPFDQFVEMYENLEHIHGCLTLLWHHSVFNEHEFPGWESEYLKILDYCKGHNAWIGSGRQIHEWWTRRQETVVKGEYSHEILKITTSPKGMQHFITIYLPDHLKIREVNNASIIRCDKDSCEIKTQSDREREGIEIIFSQR